MNSDINNILNTLHSTHMMWELYKKDLKSSIDLVTFLKKNLPHIDPKSWEERFDWGGIYVNGRPAMPNTPLIPPCKVEYFEPKLSFSEMAKLYPKFEPDKHILFEDSDILVAFKPAGLPSKPAKEQNKFSLLRALEDYTKKHLHMPSRLDVATAGVIIVSKSKRAHIALQQMFERHNIQKYYLLEVSGEPKEDIFFVDKAIGRDPRHPVLRMVSTAADAKPSQTRFTKVYSTSATTVLQAEPLTGRTHQIRVHSTSEGFPLVGDTFYNGAPDSELHLLSFRIEIEHPFTKQTLSVRVPDALLPKWIDAQKLR